MNDILTSSYLPQKKPLGYKFAIALVLLKLIILILIIVLYLIASNIEIDAQGFLAGFKSVIANAYDLDSSNSQINEGALIGSLTIPIALTIASLIFIIKRKYTVALTLVILDLVSGFSNGGSIPLSTLGVLLIMTINKSTKEYLQNKTSGAVR